MRENWISKIRFLAVKGAKWEIFCVPCDLAKNRHIKDPRDEIVFVIRLRNFRLYKDVQNSRILQIWQKILWDEKYYMHKVLHWVGIVKALSKNFIYRKRLTDSWTFRRQSSGNYITRRNLGNLVWKSHLKNPADFGVSFSNCFHDIACWRHFGKMSSSNSSCQKEKQILKHEILGPNSCEWKKRKSK